MTWIKSPARFSNYWGCLIALLGLLFARTGLAGESASNNTRLPRTNLLVYHSKNSEVLPVRSQGDWRKRRVEILQGMETVMGRLPGKDRRCPLELQIHNQSDCDSYVRREVSYASEPTSRVPAFLLIPKSALVSGKRHPALLALHPTDMEYGYRVVVEQLRTSYRAYAHDLAQRGFVVLAPAYPIMANYHPDLKALGYESGTMKAIWDNHRGIDLLESLPFVKKGKIGAIGHSLGGHNAIYTAVFDDRIKSLVSSCGFDSFNDYMDGRIQGWTSERYMPQLLDYADRLAEIPFDFHELLGALAPRPVFVIAPLGDTNFKWQSVDEIVTQARLVYRLYKHTDNLEIAHPDCPHDFPPPVREQAYHFLERHLR